MAAPSDDRHRNNMTIRIIDHKKIDLTDSEFKIYKSLCRAYDRPNFKGEDLFKGLFETDNSGIIITLLPPTKNYTSMQVLTFLQNIQINQHLRIVREQADKCLEEVMKEFMGLREEMKIAMDEIKSSKKPSKTSKKKKHIEPPTQE